MSCTLSPQLDPTAAQGLHHDPLHCPANGGRWCWCDRSLAARRLVVAGQLLYISTSSFQYFGLRLMRTLIAVLWQLTGTTTRRIHRAKG